MAEPHASIASAAAAAGGISLVAGSVLGLPFAALVFGLAGGLAALKLDTAARGLWSRVTTVAMGTVCAAASAHPLAEVLHPPETSTALWVPAVAIVVGAGAEMLLRAILRAAVHRIEQLGGTDGEGGS